MLHFFWLFFNKKGTQARKSETRTIEWYEIRPIASSLFPRPRHHSFFSVTPVSVQLVDRRKPDTMGNDYICQWHKIAVYAYPGIVNICFIGKNTFHLCENIPNLLWNFASKNKTRMQFDMLRVTFSISNYTLHYLTFAENII